MKHGVDIIDIVCIATHYLARRMGIEESDGESVHRAEEIGAQMLYRPLRYREHKSALKIGGNDSDKIDAEHQRKRAEQIHERIRPCGSGEQPLHERSLGKRTYNLIGEHRRCAALLGSRDARYVVDNRCQQIRADK